MPETPRSRARRSRTSKACDRCRRQKLKCDPTRPCVLCVRAGSKCETTPNTPLRCRRRDAQPVAAASNADGHDSSILTTQQPSPVNQTRPPIVTPSYLPSNTDPHAEGRNFNTRTSTIDFARRIFNEEETGRTLTGASIPGDTGVPEPDNTLWTLKEITLPPIPVIRALIDAYFERMQWFILLFHEPSFREKAEGVISQQQWRREDLGTVMVVLGVLAISLQSVLPDQQWPGHQNLRFHGINASDLLHGLIAEIRLCLLDSLEDCQIEGMQICFLLASYYVFHNSPNMAWTVGGMALRAAAALDLENRASRSKDPITNEVRSRCWNHLVIADTFISMLFGRATSTDPAAGIHPLQDMDDLRVDPWILNHPLLGEASGTTSRATFHVTRSEIYSIIRDTLLRYRHLQLQADMREKDVEAIVQIAHSADNALTLLYSRLPLLFNLEYWTRDNRWEQIEKELPELPSRVRNQLQAIYLQAATLQLTYDTAVIQVHRPLLDRKLDSSICRRPMMDAVYQSLDAATGAALRVSRIPVQRFKNHFAASFASMQQFTAGVILCIPPTSHPFTAAAHEAKEGVMRIIHASRSLSHYNRIAKQSEELLTELLKVTISREMSRALGEANERGSNRNLSAVGRPTAGLQDTGNATGSETPDVRKISTLAAATTGGNPEEAPSDSIQGPWTATPDPTGRNMELWDFPSAHIFHQLDSTFGAFGESFFNLVFDDQNAWNWGRTFP